MLGMDACVCVQCQWERERESWAKLRARREQSVRAIVVVVVAVCVCERGWAWAKQNNYSVACLECCDEMRCVMVEKAKRRSGRVQGLFCLLVKGRCDGQWSKTKGLVIFVCFVYSFMVVFRKFCLFVCFLNGNCFKLYGYLVIILFISGCRL